MRNESIIDLTDRLDPRRCEQWLSEMRRRTTDHGVHRLIDDVRSELALLGELAVDLSDVVVGALASVEAAVELAPR